MKTTQGSVGRSKKTTKRTARTITFNGLDDVATGVNTVFSAPISVDEAAREGSPKLNAQVGFKPKKDI